MYAFNHLKKNLKRAFNPKTKLKVALLGDTATQFLAIAIKGYALEENIAIELYEAPYNQIDLQFKNPSSDLHTFKPDFVIVFEAETKLRDDFYKTPLDQRDRFSNYKINQVEDYLNISQTALNAKLLYFNYTEVNDQVFGNFGSQYEKSYIYQCRKLNFSLGEFASTHTGLYIVDLLSLQMLFGINFMKDQKMLIQTDMYFSIDFLPYVAKAVSDIIKTQLGTFKKCLILDLDNTVWGGIIGDDGMNNIQIGGLGIGKVFTKIQKWAKELKNRGIILCVASKNTESIALEPFKKHQEMVIKEEDISVFMANWDNKVSNIQKIQEILNIGFDSMVFIDDNPFEREMVKQNLPLVTVPDLPEDPAAYLDYINSLNLFETAGVSDNDAKRTAQYKEEAKRVQAKAYFSNEEEFLASLEMKGLVESLNDFNLPRISQLSLRSNQFNLRTIRFDEEELKRFGTSPYHQVLAISLTDKYGDNGLIAAVFLSRQENDLFIHNWIMSCRVLKRNVEQFTLNSIFSYAKENNCTTITGEYIATSKNGIVENHYKDLGFKHHNNYWHLSLSDYKPFETQITTI
ncbi:HAD-IIIC family phosphatase [Pedobacter montanisoli]|uniref:HAD-IIIC family phosphatase n=1 Tax=Pedobacter montanisoli TaxID=2923277 RepID=A0ABS9ZXA9_9SPHI|nr:HAD-IIIC family phosphatase [Pedobacter montanisoli]MCJ0742961.1 HAD-IIIC family phosphatase [Pedobacter montanisoli]